MIDCAGAGRVFGVRIGLPDWNNVLAMPGHQFAYSLDEELKEEMERVSNTFNWKARTRHPLGMSPFPVVSYSDEPAFRPALYAARISDMTVAYFFLWRAVGFHGRTDY